MTIEEIKSAIALPAVPLTAGGFRPANTPEESWLGRVTAFREGESVPTDHNGEAMVPLAQFHLPSLPYLPPALTGPDWVTIFLSKNYTDLLHDAYFDRGYPEGKYFAVREYADPHEISFDRTISAHPYLKPFPLSVGEPVADHPIWDGGGLSSKMEDRILNLEREGRIPGYYEVTTHEHHHKIGGYPSFCQSGIMDDDDGFGNGYHFVLQISSDSKIGLNVVDSGSLMFARNPQTKDWSLYFDFY